jgi:hypothetical protein
MKKIKFVTAILFPVMLTGCAGSATHKVVKTDPAADQALSCQQADDEIARSQAIINGVNEDKDDVSGADVVDGILYFPFNLIAKNSNYSNALTAANQRITSLKQLKTEKNCVDDGNLEVTSAALKTKIEELDKMYADKQISEQEYKSLKLKALGL